MRRSLSLVALLLGGCAVFQDPHAGPEADAWVAARDRHTRFARLMDRFETHASASVIWQSPELRAQRVARVASWRAMTAEERAAMLRAEEAEAARWEEFVVIFATAERDDNDLDARKSVWRVALVVAGEGEEPAAEVRAITADSQLRDLYPQIEIHDLVYRVRFPRWLSGPLASRPFVLRIAGSQGQMDFAYSPPGAAVRP